MRIINLRLEEDYRSDDDDDDDGGGSLMTKQLFAASDKMENAMNRPPTHTHTTLTLRAAEKFFHFSSGFCYANLERKYRIKLY